MSGATAQPGMTLLATCSRGCRRAPGPDYLLGTLGDKMPGRTTLRGYGLGVSEGAAAPHRAIESAPSATVGRRPRRITNHLSASARRDRTAPIQRRCAGFAPTATEAHRRARRPA